MAIITFINNANEETGKSMSLVAVATYTALNYNNRILTISTTDEKDRIMDCYFDDSKTQNLRNKMLGGRQKHSFETESGIEGLAKIARSGKLTAELITNYTRVVFKDRLEVIPGISKKDRKELVGDEKGIDDEYPSLVNLANTYYDKVFVDLDFNLSEQTRKTIIDSSDIVVVNTSQNKYSIEKLKEKKATSELLNSKKCLILMGRYDRNSKYNVKNVTRYLNEKENVLAIPYNTLFMENAGEAGVPDFFISLKRFHGPSEDRNAVFVSQVKETVETIEYRLQELRAMY